MRAGKGMHSRLYKRVLNKYGWMQNCTGFNSLYDTTGIAGVSATFDTRNASQGIDVIAKELVVRATWPHVRDLRTAALNCHARRLPACLAAFARACLHNCPQPCLGLCPGCECRLQRLQASAENLWRHCAAGCRQGRSRRGDRARQECGRVRHPDQPGEQGCGQRGHRAANPDIRPPVRLRVLHERLKALVPRRAARLLR